MARLPRAELALALALLPLALGQRSVVALRGSSEELRSVFFSGDPWLIQCVSAIDITAASRADSSPAEHAHAVVQTALSAMPDEVNVAILDCKKRLPSGKNTLERFRLDDTVMPLIALVANGLPPVQLTQTHLTKAGLSASLFPSVRQQASALVNFIKERAEHKLWPVTKTEQLHDMCVDKSRFCAVVLYHGDLKLDDKRALKSILPEFRTIHFLTLNMARYDFSLARKLPDVTRDAPQLLALRSSAIASDKGAKSHTLGAKAHKGVFSSESLRDFLMQHVDGKLELTALRKPPTIAWRKQSASKGTNDGGASRKGGTRASKGSSKPASSSAPTFKDVQTERRRRHEASVRAKRDDAQQRSGRVTGGQASPKGGSTGKRVAGSGSSVSEEKREAELRRRRKMAEEEEEYVRGMFSDEEEDSLSLDVDPSWGEDADFLDLDDDEETQEPNPLDRIEAGDVDDGDAERHVVNADGSIGGMIQ